MMRSLFVLALCLASPVAAFPGGDSLRYAEYGSIFFTANKGQWNNEVLYTALHSRSVTSFSKAGFQARFVQSFDARYRLPVEQGKAGGMGFLDIKFRNPSPRLTVEHGNTLGNVSHFYSGTDTSRWYKDVPNVNTLIYRNVWDGIDILYTGGTRICQSVIVHPGADIDGVEFEIRTGNEHHTYSLAALSSNQCKAVQRLSSPQIATVADTMYVFEFEYGTYVAGTDDDYLYSIAVDDDGNAYVYGQTLSNDYPLQNAFDTTLYGHFHGVLTGLQPNGRSLRFSTILNADAATYADDINSVRTASDGTVWVSKRSKCSMWYDDTIPYYFDNGFPLTPDAKNKTCLLSLPWFIQFDRNGKVLFASYFRPDRNEYHFYSFYMDHYGNAVLAFRINPLPDNIHGPFTASFLTPGTVRDYRSPKSGFDACILKYNIKKDSVIFCTFLGHPDSLSIIPRDVAFDNENNVIVSSILEIDFYNPPSGWRRRVPLVAPANSDPTAEGYIVRFDSLARKMVFATYVPGGGIVPSLSADEFGRIHAVGSTRSPQRLQLVSPLPYHYRLNKYKPDPFGGNNYSTAYYIRMKSDGVVDRLTTFLGDSSLMQQYSQLALHLDDCGLVYVTGYECANILNILSRYHSKYAPFVAVIDSSASHVICTSSLGTYSYRNNSHNIVSSFPKYTALSRNGSLYRIETANEPAVVSENAYQRTFLGSPGVGKLDGFVQRIHLPLCNHNEACSFAAPDTVTLIKKDGKIGYKEFTIEYKLFNRGVYPLKTPTMELQAPAEITLISPASYSALPGPSPVKLMDSASAIWTVRLDTSVTHDTVLTVRGICMFGIEQDSGSLVICNKDIYINVVEIKPCNIACGIGIPDTIGVDVANQHSPNPFLLSITLRNDGDEECEIATLVLRAGKGMMLHAVPESDTLRSPGVMQPGSDYTTSFTLQLERRSIQRNIAVECIGYDRYGFEKMRCTRELVVLPIRGLECVTTCTDTIVYTPVVGVPSSISAKMELTNIADTAQRGIEVTIDLASAPHLGLKPGYPATKSLYSLDIGASVPMQWELTTIATTSMNTNDTIRFYYYALTAPERLSCECIVVVKTILVDVQCTIAAPVALVVDNYSYLPNPFELNYSLENKGTAQLDIASIAITLLPDITTTDPLTVAVTPLAPNGKHDIQWNLKAFTSAFERNVTITVTAYDSENKPVAVCEHHLYLPAITDMTCESQSTAHIVYNANDRRYEPNPVTASLVVYNHIDTVQTAIEAEIDLTTAPHLKLATGETNPQTVSTLAAKASHQFDWKLDVLPADSQVTETVSMRYRSAAHQEWRECSWTYTIDEEAKTYSATCVARGVDSLWLNGTAELIIPNPFQVYYTITNTGTGMLTNCNGTIHLPNHLQLMTGEQPKKYYGNIEPGISVQRAWMVGADPSVQSLGTHNITFSFTAVNLTTDVPCDHTVIISQRDKIDLALSHKNLYFIAKKDAALPASQQIMVYAGSPASMPWTAQGYPSWLNVQPTNGNTQSINVQPNTTAMNYGTYTGSVDFASSAPNSPKSLNVIYDIVETVGIPEVPAINGVTLYQNYPNPFSESTSISFNVESRMQVMLSVYNTLGDLISTQSVAAQPGMNTVTVSNLQPGLYMYVLVTPNGAVSRRMVRR